MTTDDGRTFENTGKVKDCSNPECERRARYFPDLERLNPPLCTICTHNNVRSQLTADEPASLDIDDPEPEPEQVGLQAFTEASGR